VWRHATTGLPPTTLPSFNSLQSGCGCALMSPRPSTVQTLGRGQCRRSLPEAGLRSPAVMWVSNLGVDKRGADGADILHLLQLSPR
jgi:hypothetical protein